MNTIKLNYDNCGEIIIGNGLIDDVGFILSYSLKPQIVHIITDENLAVYHLKRLEHSLLKAGLSKSVHVMQPGENSKTFKELERLLEEIISCGSSYTSAILAFGGGVVGDVAGLVASMLLRGVSLVHVPTTLMAQVDSSIGGKSAINSSCGKNLIGCMYIPKLILIDVSLLQTLPNIEVVYGYAEVVKYAMLYDSKFFYSLEEYCDKVLAKDLAILYRLVKRCCQIKIQIMQQDTFGMKGMRRDMLNFGHTIAHAIESASNYSILHGEAVSIGMIVESSVSDIDNTDIKNSLKKVGLPISLKEINSDLSVDLLYSYVLKDKKIRNNTLAITVLERIGKAYIEYVSCNFIRHLLDDLLS